MSDVNYTGQNVPVISFSDLDLSEQQFIEFYRIDKRIRDLTNQYIQARKNIFDALNEVIKDSHHG